jgi:galactose-1-phosphate uridylyltransferase
VGRPGKELLRVYEFALAARPFFIHHTPFPLHRGHFVLVERKHQPMRMDGRSLADLREFLRLAPSWTACSNSDIMWAGASILAHHHYQVFPHWVQPVMLAPEDTVTRFTAPGGARCVMLDYPAGVMRVQGDPAAVLAAAQRILTEWKATAPGKATANLTMRADGGELAVYLMFRHSDHRTREDLVAFKREGVGVLEIAGMVIVPEPLGDGAEKRMDTLRTRGLEIVRGIIESNSPVTSGAARADLARAARGWVVSQG